MEKSKTQNRFIPYKFNSVMLDQMTNDLHDYLLEHAHYINDLTNGDWVEFDATDDIEKIASIFHVAIMKVYSMSLVNKELKNDLATTYDLLYSKPIKEEN